MGGLLDFGGKNDLCCPEVTSFTYRGAWERPWEQKEMALAEVYSEGLKEWKNRSCIFCHGAKWNRLKRNKKKNFFVQNVAKKENLCVLDIYKGARTKFDE